MKLVMSSDSRVERQLNIRITVDGMHYNGTFVASIQSEVKEGTLHPFRGQTLKNIVFVFKSNLNFWVFPRANHIESSQI